MKKRTALFVISLFFAPCFVYAHAAPADSLARIRFVKAQTFKADSLSQAAMAVARPGTASGQLNQALNTIDQALHIYSRYRDDSGMRQSFDNMAFIYRMQKKHSQEKWYILQSNTLSRQLADTPGIISSLIRLAAVKHDIKDFNLEAEDLNEALVLSQKIKNKPEGLLGMKVIAGVYLKEGDLKIAAMILNRVDELKDSAGRLAAMKSPHPVNTVTTGMQNTAKNNGKNKEITNALFIKYIALIFSILILVISCVYLIIKRSRK